MSIESTTKDKVELCPAPLQTIITEFQAATPRERLEYLLEYALELPDLPERLQEKRDEMEQVHECQTPVFLHTELNNGQVQFFFDIPQESPTVRGYASILSEGLNQASAAQVLAIPNDVYNLLGLHEAITPQRLRGLHALLVYMKRQVQKLV